MSRWCMLWLLAPGCYTVRFHDGDVQAAGAHRERSYNVWTHSFFWGMVPVTSADVSMCDHGLLRMKSQIGGLGLLAYTLTAGIWTPMHVKLVCAEPIGPEADEPSEAAEPDVVEDTGSVAEPPTSSDKSSPAAEDPAPAPAPAGCAKDTDCKGDRICDDGACADPS